MKGKRMFVRIGVSIVAMFGAILLVGSFQQVVWQRERRTHMHIKQKPIFPEEREAIALLRKIANNRDMGRLSLTLKHLDHKSDIVRAAAALAVGRLGASGTKVENKLIQLSRSSKKDGWAAQIALARLKAEAKSSDPSEQVDIFLRELGITFSD